MSLDGSRYEHCDVPGEDPIREGGRGRGICHGPGAKHATVDPGMVADCCRWLDTLMGCA
jgi:hypothetical protein